MCFGTEKSECKASHPHTCMFGQVSFGGNSNHTQKYTHRKLTHMSHFSARSVALRHRLCGGLCDECLRGNFHSTCSRTHLTCVPPASTQVAYVCCQCSVWAAAAAAVVVTSQPANQLACGSVGFGRRTASDVCVCSSFRTIRSVAPAVRRLRRRRRLSRVCVSRSPVSGRSPALRSPRARVGLVAVVALTLTHVSLKIRIHIVRSKSFCRCVCGRGK